MFPTTRSHAAKLAGGCALVGILSCGALARAQSSTTASRRPAATPPASAAPATSGDGVIRMHTGDGSIPGATSAEPPPPTARGPIQSGSSPVRESTGPTAALRGPAAPMPGEGHGPIGPADMPLLIRAQMPRLRPCYDRARARHHGLMGRVELRFTIAADGRVTQAAAYGLPEAPEVATCLSSALRETAFPRPQSAPLATVYAMMFTPEAAAPRHGHAAAPAPAHAPAQRP
jgi:hypothetical protein